MELFTIDPNDSNRRLMLIEEYESFIWTDRYSEFGDVTLVLKSTQELVARLPVRTLVGLDESEHVMIVKSVLRETKKDKKKILTIKGVSLEEKFMDRVAKKVLSAAPWSLTGTAGVVARTMVNDICVAGTGIGTSSDIIPNMTATDLSGLTTSKTFKIKGGTLYEEIKALCDAYNVGFRVAVTPGLAPLRFEVYVGTDRTGPSGVIFSEDLDTLTDTSYLLSEENYKNKAYIFAPNGTRILSATGASVANGLDRAVILVDASDITTAAGATLQSELLERGMKAFAEHKKIALFDGTVNPNTQFRYNRDYFLGDKVLLRSDDGINQIVTVTEHIWSGNASGLTSYPTLTPIGGA